MASTEERARRLGFAAASLSFITVFAASAAPIPLYGLYRADDGLTYGDLALTAVSYFAGALTALLVFGRLSNHLGRRPAVLLSLGLAAIACVILLHVPSVKPLIQGRILQGLACGLAASATAAFVVDNGSPRAPWLAAAVVSSGPMIGLTVGALASGALIEYGPLPRVLPYLMALASLAVCALLIVASRETGHRRPGLAASLRPRAGLPRASRRFFPVAACTFIATWALGGFYQAFGPSMATDQLGSTSALISAAVVASFMAPSLVGGRLAARLRPATAQRTGMLAFALCVMAILVSLKIGEVVPFLIASAGAGAAQGVALSGSLRSLLTQVAPDERAGALSVIFATSYGGAAVPSFVAGQLSRTFNLLEIATGYGVLAVAACVITLVAARDPAPDENL